jgi:purine-nucleoside phosphorylase
MGRIRSIVCRDGNGSAVYDSCKVPCKCIGIFTISDSLVTHEATSAEERQSSFNDMVKIALGTL